MLSKYVRVRRLKMSIMKSLKMMETQRLLMSSLLELLHFYLYVVCLFVVFSQLNFLNMSLRRTNASIIDFMDKVNGFQAKLHMWKRKMKNM